MQRALVRMFRIVPVRALYAVTALVIPFYMLLHRSGYRSSYSFLRNRIGWGPLRSFFGVYRNHFVFGQIILDRFATYAGRKFSFEIEGEDILRMHLDDRAGFEIVSSHVGNYELAGYSISTSGRRFNALVFSGETETVMAHRNRMFSSNNISMVPMKEDLSHIFLLNAALERGEVISLPGDRIFGSSKSVECPFFGEPAKFPAGPFVLSLRKAAPAVAIFVMKERARVYRVIVSGLCGKNERELVSDFSGKLEAVLKRYPTQWFNYFDFWA